MITSAKLEFKPQQNHLPAISLLLNQFFSETKMIKTLQRIKERCLIQKSDNGHGSFLIRRVTYNSVMK